MPWRPIAKPKSSKKGLTPFAFLDAMELLLREIEEGNEKALDGAKWVISRMEPDNPKRTFGYFIETFRALKKKGR